MGYRTSMRDGIDEYTLLCEACGYVIEGLPREGQCPECGKAVAESLPERRTGTPYQHRTDLFGVFQTWWLCLFNPKKTLDSISFDQPSRGLRRVSVLIAAAPPALSVSAGYFAIVTQGAKGSSPTIAALISIALLGCGFGLSVGLLLLLTKIEQMGLGVIGRSRDFRITPAIAANVCDHATIGWVVASAMSSLATAVILVIEIQPMVSLSLWYAAIPLALAIPGFLYFETFAYLGLRRCKFANRSRPEKRKEETENEERRAGSPSH
jgi:predicted RNA-binding Zn-ribbon protein involved in translation (DUF1610 family)